MQLWIAFGALTFTVLGSLATGGFLLGRAFERLGSQGQRLAELERDDRVAGVTSASAHAALALAVARLEVGQTHLIADVAAIKTRLQ